MEQFSNQNEESTLRVMVFDDNDQVRESLKDYFESTDQLQLVGAFRNCEQLTRRIERGRPDVVLMDIQMPGMNGIEAVTDIRKNFLKLPVVMLTVFEDNEKIFAAICAGASGYIHKSVSAEKIIEAIVDAYRGGSPLSPAIARKVLNIMQQEHKGMEAEHFALSFREKEILTCLVKGMSYKMIGTACDIARDTVHTHIKTIYSKLHVHCAAEAVSKALQLKIV